MMFQWIKKLFTKETDIKGKKQYKTPIQDWIYNWETTGLIEGIKSGEVTVEISARDGITLKRPSLALVTYEKGVPKGTPPQYNKGTEFLTFHTRDNTQELAVYEFADYLLCAAGYKTNNTEFTVSLEDAISIIKADDTTGFTAAMYGVNLEDK